MTELRLQVYLFSTEMGKKNRRKHGLRETRARLTIKRLLRRDLNEEIQVIVYGDRTIRKHEGASCGGRLMNAEEDGKNARTSIWLDLSVIKTVGLRDIGMNCSGTER